MSTPERIAKRIAKNNIDLLSKRDILTLMDKIIEFYGNVSKACDLVGIDRKTYYNWKRYSKSIRSKWTIKPECKEKVLAAALMLNPIYTLDKLTSKAFDKTCDLLYFTLSTIHEMILDSEDAKEKEELTNKFIIFIVKYKTSPVEHLMVEINDMLADIKDECPWYNFEQKLKISTRPFEFTPEMEIKYIKHIESEELRQFNCLTKDKKKEEEEILSIEDLGTWGVTINA